MARDALAELDRMLAEMTAGLDLSEAEQALAAGLRAIRKQMQALEAKDYARADMPDVAKAVAQTVKGLDELYRLTAFAKGQPDSRPDFGRGSEWLALLPDGLLEQVREHLDRAAGGA